MARASQGAFLLVVLLFAPFGAAQTYNITDLGPASGGGRGISIDGEVVGDNGVLAFAWSPTKGRFNLPPLPGSRYGETVVGGINATGIIAGESLSVSNYHAVVWRNGVVHDLGTLSGGVLSWATAINDSGVVAGASDGTGFQPNAMIWSDAVGMQRLGTFKGGSYSEAFSINRYSHVTGFSDVANGNSYGFIWSPARGMRMLPSLRGGGGSSGNGINNAGQIAGGSGCGAGCLHAVLWTESGGLQDLGVLNGATFSSAYAINNLGQVVGSSGYIATFEHAFLWSDTAGMQDLNDLIPPNSGWLLEYAFAINDVGQITGQGTVNGQTHAFLLTPQ